jgi:hypothetical protein
MKLPKFKLLETPTDGKKGEFDVDTGPLNEEVCKLPKSHGTTAEIPS